jgi:CHAD domain-containing protein
VEREAKLQRAIESMREEWYLPLLDRMVAAAAAPELTGRSDRLADPTIVRLARKPWQRLREAVQRLPTEPSSEELHRVRILTKRARYAVEAVAVIGGPAADHFAFRLAELQGVLGEHQDAIVAAAWLRRRVPAQARAAGELIGFEVARSNRAAEGWRESWASVERRPLIRWMD